MSCAEIKDRGDVVGYVCREEMKITTQKPNGEPRWCFVCRKRMEFEYIVSSPVGISYYEPNPSIRCVGCRKPDADLFPGRYREWA